MGCQSDYGTSVEEDLFQWGRLRGLHLGGGGDECRLVCPVEYYSPSPPLYFFKEERGLLTYLLFVFSVINRVLSHEMLLLGKYKGNLQYHEVDMVKTLPLPVSVDRALALATPPSEKGEGSDN